MRRVDRRSIIDNRLSTGDYNFARALRASASKTPMAQATTLLTARSANVNWASTVRGTITANQTATTTSAGLVATASNAAADSTRYTFL